MIPSPEGRLVRPGNRKSISCRRLPQGYAILSVPYLNFFVILLQLNSVSGGSVPESALSDYKIMGLRVGQKENIADFINDDLKKYVALLDLNNDIFHVADYKGDLLTRLMARITSHKSDWTLTMLILTTISEYASLAYVLAFEKLSTPIVSNQANGFLKKWISQGGSKTKDASGILKLQNGDLRIVRYFVELLRMQSEGDDEEVEEADLRKEDMREENYENGLLLDYEPAHLHKM